VLEKRFVSGQFTHLPFDHNTEVESRKKLRSAIPQISSVGNSTQYPLTQTCFSAIDLLCCTDMHDFNVNLDERFGFLIQLSQDERKGIPFPRGYSSQGYGWCIVQVRDACSMGRPLIAQSLKKSLGSAFMLLV